MSKPKVGFYWCASCGGCEEAVVDLDEALLDVVAAVDVVFWPVALDFKRSDVEAMADGEMAVCFLNGAIRTSEQEEMAHLLRKKAGLLIAFGSCAHMGGIPGLSNMSDREDILNRTYSSLPSTSNPDGTRPATETPVNGHKLTLPYFQDTVRSLDQVVDVDYYLPGCPPPVELIQGAVGAILAGELPPKGTVLAPDVALCSECNRKESKPDDLSIIAYKRPWEIEIDTEECLLAQGLLCMGPATRSGCGSLCVEGNMPCTGCLGPTSAVLDQGAKALSGFASLLSAKEEGPVQAATHSIVDVAGTFYRYSLPVSLLQRRQESNNPDSKGEQDG